MFDFLVKLLRAFFVDMAGNSMERDINDSLFKKITSHDHKFLNKTSGVAHTVREFAEIAFARADLDYEEFVQTSEKYFRPNEVHNLIGDFRKAKKLLKWKPLINFDKLISEMIDSDLKKIF